MMLLAACIKPCAIIARRSSSSSRGLLNFSCPADLANYYSAGPPERSGGAMSFYDHTLYGRDDEMDEFGDSGAFSEPLEEDLEEEDEEKEESPQESCQEACQEEGCKEIRQEKSGAQAGQESKEKSQEGRAPAVSR